MKILITGANGYLGCGVVKQLCLYKCDVVAADFAVEHIHENVEKKACNIFEIEDPYEYFGKPDVLLHMAWKDGFIHNSDAHITDLSGHYLFLKKMIASGIKRVAVIGTMHEIGFHEGSINENTVCSPMNLYGISKDALRKTVMLMASQNNISWQWLRGFYIVGNTPFGNSIFSKLIAAANEGKKEFPFTMGQNQYDFLDYEIFCRQTAAAVMQDNICGIINICSGRPEKLSDRVERFIRENQLNIRLNYGAFPDRPYDSKAVWGNSEKIDTIMEADVLRRSNDHGADQS